MLPSTYSWALQFHVDPLADTIRRSRSPLIAIGSGGSFTAAYLAAAFHVRQYGLPALASSPLEAVRADLGLRESAVLLLTAGGKNPDILGAFDNLIRREPRRLSVVCATSGSKLADAVQQYSTVEFCEFDPPAGRDGFLATNSLLATGVILARAYGTVGRQDLDLPPDLAELCGPAFGEVDYSPLLARQTLLVIHPPALKAVAVDIESKFIEAALGNVQIADFRQFAHGRHHWLAKRGEESAVLALSLRSDPADYTLRLLPKSVPSVVLDLPHEGPVACLGGIVHAFDLVRQAGLVRGIDPGDPGVPPFGRELYNFNVYRRSRPARTVVAEPGLAIERKLGVGPQRLPEPWREAHATFLDRLAKARVSAIVTDYDGTLCDEATRFRPMPDMVAAELTRLLRAGLHLGVATGRGQSVRKLLREAVPEKFWGQVVVGYYNGSDIGLLSDDDHPDGTEIPAEQLRQVAQMLVRLQQFLGVEPPELRRNQITLKSGSCAVEFLWQRVQGLVAPHLFPGVTVLRSGHSVDVLAPEVSKLAVVRRTCGAAGCEEAEVLCIGDQGCWPGNDHALLGTPLSLSSNLVSADPTRCWNLAPAGVREARATLGYLRLLERSRGAVRFRLPALPGTRT